MQRTVQLQVLNNKREGWSVFEVRMVRGWGWRRQKEREREFRKGEQSCQLPPEKSVGNHSILILKNNRSLGNMGRPLLYKKIFF